MLTDEAIVAALKGKHWDRQMSICLRPRYGKWGKCTQCIAKVGGDSCRFRDYRIFPYVATIDVNRAISLTQQTGSTQKQPKSWAQATLRTPNLRSH